MLRKIGNGLRNYHSSKKQLLLSALMAAIFIGVIIMTSLGQRAGATTIGASGTGNAMNSQWQRGTVIASTGTFFAAYNASNGETPNGLVFRTSTNNGASWGSSTQILSTTNASNDFSLAIDTADNIYLAYHDATGGVNVIKLAYSAGVWTPGSPTVLAADITCSAGTGVVDNSTPTIAINSGNIIIVNWLEHVAAWNAGALDCISSSTYTFKSSKSPNGSIYGSAYTLATSSSGATAPIVAVGSGVWAVVNNGATSRTIYKDTTSGGSWTSTTTNVVSNTITTVSLASYASDQLDIFYRNSTTTSLEYVKYTISSNSAAAATTISSAANDVAGTISAGSGSSQLYVFYQSYVAANQYNVVYKKFDGSSWASGPAITSDNLNNMRVSSSVLAGNGYIPIIWSEGTSSPYNIDAAAVAINLSPSAPTLTTPYTNGTTVISTTPTLQMRSSDGENDYLRYRVYVYDTTANNGTNCTGSAISGSPFTEPTGTPQTGWATPDAGPGNNTAFAGNATLSSSTLANYTVATTLTRGNSYCWQADAIDPGGSNIYGSKSTPQTFTVDSLASAPTLIEPASGQKGILINNPLFRLSTTDADSDYLKYEIQVCSTSNCSAVVNTYCQASDGATSCTGSPTGWRGQSLQSATAYSSAQQAEYQYQGSPLTGNTHYWWRAWAIDPGGTNAYSSASSIGDFWTADLQGATPTSHDIFIGGH